MESLSRNVWMLLRKRKKGVFNAVSLSESTITRPIEEIGGNVHTQLRQKIKEFSLFFLSTGGEHRPAGHSTAQLVLFTVFADYLFPKIGLFCHCLFHSIICFLALFSVKILKSLFDYVWLSGRQYIFRFRHPHWPQTSIRDAKSYVALTGKSLGTPDLKYFYGFYDLTQYSLTTALEKQEYTLDKTDRQTNTHMHAHRVHTHSRQFKTLISI